MKVALKSIYFIICLILISCSGEKVQDPTDDGPGTEKPFNKAPSPPKLISPQNDLACTYSTMNFEWQSSTDPEGTDVSYELEVSLSLNFEELYKTAATRNTFVSLDLEEGSTYYWRVLSKDKEGTKSDPFEVRSFFTEPSLTYNSIPQNPNSENPVNSTTVDLNTSLLEWTSTDEDGDVLKFDVYFGTSNPPPLAGEDREETFFEVNLNEATTYFWQIVAKDTKGAKAIGLIWYFNVN